MAMASNSKEILYDISPFLIAYKDGTFKRLMPIQFVPASVDPKTGVQSKDVQISPVTNLSARLYLPKDANPAKKLPILVYYHGGGFMVESAFSPVYQKHINTLVAIANIVVVSVNYRIAPEHRLPIAYDDSWLALEWVGSRQDEWIKDYADMDRVYLGGDSAGGNITHTIAMRVGSVKPYGINLRGFFLNCPYFCGKDTLPNEGLFPKIYWNCQWRYLCPSREDVDDPRVNPGMDPKLWSLGGKKVLIYVGGLDTLKVRGWYYKEVLEKSGWKGKVEIVEVDGEDHVFSVLHPESADGLAMIKRVASFINNN